MGGYAALAFAVRHPARLAALVLCDTRAAADSAETRKARDGAIGRIKATGSGPYLDGSLARLLSPAAPPALVAFLRARAETRAASLIAGIEALRDRPDRTGELGAIRVPTLAIRGDGDQVTPAEDMQQMAGAIAGATFVTIPGAGHLSHVEAPAAFERALTPFLATALKGDSEMKLGAPLFERVQAAARAVAEQLDLETPSAAVVLGSGLGGVADRLTDARRVPYASLPCFPETTVAGHPGRLVAGKIGGTTGRRAAARPCSCSAGASTATRATRRRRWGSACGSSRRSACGR